MLFSVLVLFGFGRHWLLPAIEYWMYCTECIPHCKILTELQLHYRWCLVM